MTTFRQLLEQFDESAKTRTAKGNRFEDFCEAFFNLGQAAGYDFDEVWSWNDWPGNDGLAGDTGIDLVARERGSGDLVAIQCKFYSPQATLSWTNAATFIGMLGQPQFSSGLLVSTAGSESANLHTNIQRTAKPIRVWRVEDFEGSAVDWDQFRIDRPTQLALRDPKQLRPHQEQAIADVSREFETHPRGQMIMACGTGKFCRRSACCGDICGPVVTACCGGLSPGAPVTRDFRGRFTRVADNPKSSRYHSGSPAFPRSTKPVRAEAALRGPRTQAARPPQPRPISHPCSKVSRSRASYRSGNPT